MSWWVKCTDQNCRERNVAANIVDLLDNCRDESGIFRCACGKQGYVEKHFKLQEKGQTWDPYLVGAIRLGETKTATYQPFVFLTRNEEMNDPNGLWFSYYKDTRPEGGRLKLGYGPGGPPVLDKDQVKRLIKELLKVNYLSKQEFLDLVK